MTHLTALLSIAQIVLKFVLLSIKLQGTLGHICVASNIGIFLGSDF